jgi:hypothetical protein
MISPPAQLSHEDDVVGSSESHVEAGILSDGQEGLIAPEEDEDFQEEESHGLKHKLALAHDKQLSKNDHIIVRDNEIFIRKNDDDDDVENLNDMNIVIQDSNQKKPTEKTKVVAYETFESSSEEEFSQGAFESAAQSFHNKEKNPEGSTAQDQKRLERQRRKERKFLEKKRTKQEQDRQKRKNMRRKYRL